MIGARPATKWRNDVATGVSPWNRIPQSAVSPEGTTGTFARSIHVALSGLRARVRSRIHGFAPVATPCRPIGTKLTPGRYMGAEEVEDDGDSLVKKIAGYHQFRGVREAVRATAIAAADPEKLKASTTVDWLERDSVRAKLRNLVRVLLRRYKYPPDGTPAAIELVMKQAEALAEGWSNEEL